MYDDVLSNLEDFANKNFVPIIRKQSQNILVNLIKDLKPKKILEVGTAIGYSGIIMLRAAPSAHLTTIEKDPQRHQMAKQAFCDCGVSQQVNAILGDANQILENLDEKFDFVFLDGPKSHYATQLPHILRHLSKGGIIVADNVLFMGQVLNGEYPKHKHRTTILKLRLFLHLAQNDSSLETKLLEIEDGILIIKKIK